MSVIRRDFIGLYIFVNGGVARCLNKKTRYKEGDKVSTCKFSQSTLVGVGKDNTCKKGKYLEYWRTTGILNIEYSQWKREGTLEA